MICPKCKTENGDRTICTKCGKFMYRPDVNNRKKMTSTERAFEDAKIVGKGAYRVFRVVWIILVLICTSFWLIALLMWLTGASLG